MIKNSAPQRKLTRADQTRLFVSFLAAIVGLGLMYSVQVSQRDNPPPDANIGAGMIDSLGLFMAVAGGAVLLGSILYILIRSRSKNPWLMRGLPVLIVGVIVLVGWYAIAGADLAQKANHRKELEGRYGSFVAYLEPVDYSLVSGRKTGSVTTNNPVSPDVVTVDLYGCSPGVATVKDAGGTTYFAFSGVESDDRTSGFSDCIFYLGRETNGQAWDGTLHTKCTWFISKTLADNTIQYPVTATGMQFGDLLGHCRDLRTRTAPTDLNS